MSDQTSSKPQPHAFLSYVHEDSAEIDLLERILAAAGVPVWRDRQKLGPGDDWKLKIREAIHDGSLAFVAVFSSNAEKKDQSYQNEELVLATEMIRSMRPGRVWLIPVRLDECELPAFDIGGGRNLDSLQRVDLFGKGRDEELARLVASVTSLLAKATPDAATVRAALDEAEAEDRGPRLADALRRILLDPAQQIEVDQLVTTEARSVHDASLDVERFPVDTKIVADQAGAQLVVERDLAYLDLVLPLAHMAQVGGSWGTPQQARIWTRAMEATTAARIRPENGVTILLDHQALLPLPVLYAGAIAAIEHENWAMLRAFAIDAQMPSRFGDEMAPLVANVDPVRVWTTWKEPSAALVYHLTKDFSVGQAVASMFNGGAIHYTPVSDALHAVLHPMFRTTFTSETAYDFAFDRTEILLAVLAQDVELQLAEGDSYVRGPWYGRFTWRNRYDRTPLPVRMRDAALKAGPSWGPLSAGLFGGEPARVEAAFNGFIEDLKHISRFG